MKHHPTQSPTALKALSILQYWMGEAFCCNVNGMHNFQIFLFNSKQQKECAQHVEPINKTAIIYVHCHNY
jgi:hypothetical protein